MYRCIDQDDDHKNRSANKCTCPDPHAPVPRAMWKWANYHRLMVETAQFIPSVKDLDVVFLGDSITEAWNGTKWMGTIELEAGFKQVWDQYFNLEAGGKLEGLALGASGDQAPHLLWHLKNGVMTDKLRPKAFVLLIGTNDLGNAGCSKRTALSGIMFLIQYLRQQRPDALLFIHGILPRGAAFGMDKGKTNHTLGLYWQDISWINAQLKKFCHLEPKRYTYMDASDIFIDPDKQVILEELMPDALHPGVTGRKLWAPRIFEQLSSKLKQRESEGVLHDQTQLEKANGQP